MKHTKFIKTSIFLSFFISLSLVACTKNDTEIIVENIEPIPAETETKEQAEETEEIPQTEQAEQPEEKAQTEEIEETPKAEVAPKDQEEPTVKPVNKHVENDLNWNHNYDTFSMYEGEKPGYVFQPAFGEYVKEETTHVEVPPHIFTEEELAWGEVPWGSAAALTNDISRKDEFFGNIKTFNDYQNATDEEREAWGEWARSLNN